MEPRKGGHRRWHKYAMAAASAILIAQFAGGTVSGEHLATIEYEVIDLGTFGGELSNAFGLNELGEVVGQAEEPSTATRGFLWRDGVLTDLGALNESGTGVTAYAINEQTEIVGTSLAPDPGFPGAHSAMPFYWSESEGMIRIAGDDEPWFFGIARDINDAGTVVGVWRSAAFTWTVPGGYAELPLLPRGLADAEAMAINNDGVIVGWARDAGAWTRPVRWRGPHAIHELATLGGKYGIANDVNSEGWIAGEAENDVGGIRRVRPVVWDPSGRVVEIPLLNDGDAPLDTGYAEGINDLGVVVGWDSSSASNDGRQIGWIRDAEGEKHRLNDGIDPAAGWDIRIPLDINSRGQIVGIGTLTKDGVNYPGRAFLLTPRAADIRLAGHPVMVRGAWYVDLSWGGATSDIVQVFRDNQLIATPDNDGSYRDSLGRHPVGTALSYQVCDQGIGSCSALVRVTVGR